jgi:signal transduction histidine kinase
MKKLFHTLYGKISAVFLVLLLILGLIQTWVSVHSSMNFVNESDQKLNLNLARDLAKEFTPFLEDSIAFGGIMHTMHYMMVMNPRVEIYMLDGNGKILAFFAEPGKTVKQDYVSLGPIQKFINSAQDMPIEGDDPRNIGKQKPFSATTIDIGQDIHGYLYVILGGEQYDSASAMIKESYIIRTTAISLTVILALTGVVGLVLFRLLTKRFQTMTAAVKRFEQGNFSQRLSLASNDEIGQLAKAFNGMADTIVANMEELKRTDDLRRELVANVSHDLRSPLASVQGYLETILIKDEKLQAGERQRYLQIIFDNTKMLGKLVGELFELSKLDAKQIQPKAEPFSMAELTQDVVMKFKPQAEKQKVNLQANLAKDLPMVQADIGMIERALSNLIENALRYTPERGTVNVDLQNHRNKVRVVISDTGCGIPAEEIPKIFDRFYRIEKSRARAAETTSLAGGAGLGLAIAKRILDLHESEVSVQSALNAGTAFSFDLKAAPIDARL